MRVALHTADDLRDMQQLARAVNFRVPVEYLLDERRARARQADDEDRARILMAVGGVFGDPFFREQLDHLAHLRARIM
ncbi:MAG: hypothetical protein LRY54_04970, partial [Alphaproteobacteria bacterium]|nr:hypothetical protein [Alphaproteobacteria bacterium]